MNQLRPSLERSPDRDTEKPNYRLRRRLAAAGITAATFSVGVAVGESDIISNSAQNIKTAIEQRFADPMDKYGCEISGQERVLQGETTWDKYSVPLADQLGVPIDEAQAILNDANPGVNLGAITPESPALNTVVCDPSKAFESH